MLNLVFFGPPGVGKGTQAANVAKHFGLIHVSTGDILRNEIERETPLGLEVKDAMHRGELVPDALLIKIMEQVCDQHKDANGFVFDGFPRTLMQAEALDELMQRKKCKVQKVISLQVPEKELLQRLIKRAAEQGRKDDTEEVIKNRLVIYRKHTEPLIAYYKEKGIFVEINGVGTVQEVFDSICAVVQP
jgi:adenylate kinase